MTFKPTIRLRLTLVYGGMFLAAGALLLALNYALVQRSLEREAGPVGVMVGPGIGGPEHGAIDFVRPAPAPGQMIVSNGRPLEDVLAQFEAELREQTLHELVVQSLLALALMALASVGLGWMLAGRVLRPIQAMTATARRLSDTNLHERLALEGPADELKELADTFDGMLGRLESAFESQRRFVANASHELRTPLAIQRTVVDVALADPDTTPQELRTMATSVRDAVDRSEGIIDGLLVLARSQQGVGVTEPVDLADVAGAALDQAGSEIAGAGLTVRRALRPAPLTGNRVLLERMAANLVDNAIGYNVAGGWVEVTTDGASLTVRNSGVPIPPGEVAGLFEPFRRLAPDRVDAGARGPSGPGSGRRGPSGPGSGRRGPSGLESGRRGPSGPGSGRRGHGLGLSIVQAVATAHGGTVRAEALAGGGLSVTVELQRSSR